MDVPRPSAHELHACPSATAHIGGVGATTAVDRSSPQPCAVTRQRGVRVLSFIGLLQRTRARTLIVALLVALLAAVVPIARMAGVARADGAPLKAVIIVGPTHEQTDGNLYDGEIFAQQAEALGYDVRRVFHPYATWENVLANIQGANLVVYMGHGYGWPSPYTNGMKENRQNGMGLNTYAGSGPAERTYYGANLIKANVRLAPNAVVILNHLCYSAGNGESSMPIPTEDVARERVDNMANGWLAAGAGVVFASTWGQSLDMPLTLATTDQTMDNIFMTPSPGIGSPDGYIGWHDVRLPSYRTPGALVHLDPHPDFGYMRALTGRLDMTTAEWRAGAGQLAPPPPAESLVPLVVNFSTPKPAALFATDADALSGTTRLQINLNQIATVTWRMVDSAGATVRTLLAGSQAGPGAVRFDWDGRADDGSWVPEGWYSSVVEATTVLGGYALQQRAVYVGAFQVMPSVNVAFRGGSMTLRIASTEALAGAPTVQVIQPGVAPWTVQASNGGRKKYRVTVTLQPYGDAGAVQFLVSGTDKYGGFQQTVLNVTLN